MIGKTFKLDVTNGSLAIPPEVTEYLRQCQEAVEVSLTIQSPNAAMSNFSSASEKHQKDIQAAWAHWFDEVDQLEPESPKSELDEYGKALLEKYKHQGLDL